MLQSNDLRERFSHRVEIARAAHFLERLPDVCWVVPSWNEPQMFLRGRQGGCNYSGDCESKSKRTRCAYSMYWTALCCIHILSLSVHILGLSRPKFTQIHVHSPDSSAGFSLLFLFFEVQIDPVPNFKITQPRFRFVFDPHQENASLLIRSSYPKLWGNSAKSPLFGPLAS